jgi:hypothetical protein
MSSGLRLGCEDGSLFNHLRSARGADKVETGVHTEVLLVGTERLLLLAHVALVLVVDKVDNGGPRVAVVDIVAKAGCVNNSELNVEATLLEVGLEDLDLGRLVELLGKAGVLVRRNAKVEQWKSGKGEVGGPRGPCGSTISGNGAR